jgi:hypothetical protein
MNMIDSMACGVAREGHIDRSVDSNRYVSKYLKVPWTPSRLLSQQEHPQINDSSQ